MKKYMSKKVIGLVMSLAIVSTLAMPSVALAEDHAHVTVTAQALFLSITNTPNTWTVNGIGGSGLVNVDTIYYSNPTGETTVPSATVLAGECQFNVSNHATGTPCDLTVDWGAFTGGDTTMTNSGTGANGATTYGAYSYYEGQTFANAVVVKDTGSNEMYNASSGLASGASLKWGLQIETRTGVWTGGAASTSNVTITATKH